MSYREYEERLAQIEAQLAALQANSPATADDRLQRIQALTTEVATVAEAAKATAVNLADSQRQVAAILTEAQARQSDVAAVATQAAAARTQITSDQAVIATRSEHIEKAQEHADTVRANLDRIQTSVTQQATEAEGQKARAQAAADAGTELLAQLRTTKGTAESESTAIAALRKTAEEATNQTRTLAEKADSVQTRIAEYERRHAEFEVTCKQHLQTIETLLRGATSAGLAHAFDSRRAMFLKPHSGWQKIFVGSVLAIVILTLTGLWHVYQTGVPPTYDELLRLWLGRLPIAIALVWLALHASHEAALAKRLEEDYGYKAAIAACFEGFRKQMSEIGTSVSPDSQLAKLCDNTLKAIASPPGRIYDQHQLVVTPSKELTDATRATAEAVNAVGKS